MTDIAAEIPKPWPSALAIQEAFAREDHPLDNLECMFADMVMWYEGFKNANRVKGLQYRPDELAVIVAKRKRSREQKDWKTADTLRDVLLAAGVRVNDKTA